MTTTFDLIVQLDLETVGIHPNDPVRQALLRESPERLRLAAKDWRAGNVTADWGCDAHRLWTLCHAPRDEEHAMRKRHILSASRYGPLSPCLEEVLRRHLNTRKPTLLQLFDWRVVGRESKDPLQLADPPVMGGFLGRDVCIAFMLHGNCQYRNQCLLSHQPVDIYHARSLQWSPVWLRDEFVLWALLQLPPQELELHFRVVVVNAALRRGSARIRRILQEHLVWYVRTYSETAWPRLKPLLIDMHLRHILNRPIFHELLNHVNPHNGSGHWEPLLVYMAQNRYTLLHVNSWDASMIEPIHAVLLSRPRRRATQALQRRVINTFLWHIVNLRALELYSPISSSCSQTLDPIEQWGSHWMEREHNIPCILYFTRGLCEQLDACLYSHDAHRWGDSFVQYRCVGSSVVSHKDVEVWEIDNGHGLCAINVKTAVVWTREVDPQSAVAVVVLHPNIYLQALRRQWTIACSIVHKTWWWQPVDPRVASRGVHYTVPIRPYLIVGDEKPAMPMFPAEIWEMISDYVDPSLPLSQVCRGLHCLLAWRDVSISMDSHAVTLNLMELFAHIPRPRRLQLTGMSRSETALFVLPALADSGLGYGLQCLSIDLTLPMVNRVALEALVYFVARSHATHLSLAMNGITLNSEHLEALRGLQSTGQGRLLHLILRLGGCSLHDMGFSKIAHLLVSIVSTNESHIRRLTLDVRSNTLTAYSVDISLQQVFEAVESRLQLQTLRLRLSFNPLSDAGVPGFVGRMKTLVNLTLTLDNCFIHDDGLLLLVSLGKMPVLKRLALQLSWNLLTHASVDTLCIIAHAPRLSTLSLYLSCNQLRDAGLIGLNKLTQILRPHEQSLLLDVRDNQTVEHPTLLLSGLLEFTGNKWTVIY